MLESRSWKNKIVPKYEGWKDVMVFLKTFDYYHRIFNFGNFFSCPVKLQKNLKLKFRWKFNHGFINHGYLHSAVWKALCNFKVKRAQETRDTQFLFQNVKNNEILEIFKIFKNNRWINVYYTKMQTLVVLGLLVLFSTGCTLFG